MSAPPEQVIRNYVDQNGETEARVRHLLMTFGVHASDAEGRERIAQSLAAAGVEVDRPLARLDEEEPIRLSLAAAAPARRLPPLLAEHSRPVQVLLAGVVPALYGALTGVMLGISEPVYAVLSVLGILGAVAAGFDHIGPRAGALRGIVAGSVFGAFILIAHEIHGEAAKANIPHPGIVLVAITTGFAVPLAALGGWLRRRREREGRVEHAPAVPGPLG
jgi:hypothetical protein